MAYRGLLYFVTQSASYDSRVDPYATEHRRLPNRTHGIRYASTPKRSACIKTYAPSLAVRPACASVHEEAKPTLASVDAKRLAIALVAIVVFAIVCAFAGVIAAQGIVGYVDDEVIPLVNPYGENNQTRAENLSDPQSSWEQGTVPALYQNDPQWADRPYGSGTIGSNGSAALCLSMVHITMTGDTSVGPIDVASYSQRSGYADATDEAGLVTDGATGLGLIAHEVNADEPSIRRQLVTGHPVIALLQSSSFDNGTAYIVLTDIDEHGKVIVNDPLSRDRSQRHWSFEEITSLSNGLWAYTVAD